MDVRNCRNCGRLFNYIGGPNICQACRDETEKKFADVKEYIQDNPHCSMQDISDANDVTINQIRQWVREERLQFSDDSPIGIECESCGAIIKTGKYCEACKNKMANSLNDAIKKHEPAPEPPKKQPSTNKMRFISK